MSKNSIGNNHNLFNDTLIEIDKNLDKLEKRTKHKYAFSVSTEDAEKIEELLEEIDKKGSQGMKDYFTTRENALSKMVESLNAYNNISDKSSDSAKEQFNLVTRWANAYIALGGSINDSVKAFKNLNTAQEIFSKIEKNTINLNERANGGYRFTIENFKELFDLMKEVAPYLENPKLLSKNSPITVMRKDVYKQEADKAFEWLKDYYNNEYKELGIVTKEYANNVYSNLGKIIAKYGINNIDNLPDFAKLSSYKTDLSNESVDSYLVSGKNEIENIYKQQVEAAKIEFRHLLEDNEASFKGNINQIKNSVLDAINIVEQKINDTSKRITILNNEQKQIIKESLSFEQMKPVFDENNEIEKRKEGSYNTIDSFNEASIKYEQLMDDIQNGAKTSEQAIDEMGEHLFNAIKNGSATGFKSDQIKYFENLVSLLNEQLEKIQELENELIKLKEDYNKLKEDYDYVNDENRYLRDSGYGYSYHDEYYNLKYEYDELKNSLDELNLLLNEKISEIEHLKTNSNDEKSNSLTNIQEFLSKISLDNQIDISPLVDELVKATNLLSNIEEIIKIMSNQSNDYLKNDKNVSNIDEISSNDEIKNVQENYIIISKILSDVVTILNNIDKQIQSFSVENITSEIINLLSNISNQIQSFGSILSSANINLTVQNGGSATSDAIKQMWRLKNKELEDYYNTLFKPKKINVKSNDTSYKINESLNFEDIANAMFFDDRNNIARRYDNDINAFIDKYKPSTIDSLKATDPAEAATRMSEFLSFIKDFAKGRKDDNDTLGKLLKSYAGKIPKDIGIEDIENKIREMTYAETGLKDAISGLENIQEEATINTVVEKLEEIREEITKILDHFGKIDNTAPDLTQSNLSTKNKTLKRLYDDIEIKDNGNYATNKKNKDKIKSFMEQYYSYGGGQWDLDEFARINNISDKNLKMLKDAYQEIESIHSSTKETVEDLNQSLQKENEILEENLNITDNNINSLSSEEKIQQTLDENKIDEDIKPNIVDAEKSIKELNETKNTNIEVNEKMAKSAIETHEALNKEADAAIEAKEAIEDLNFVKNDNVTSNEKLAKSAEITSESLKDEADAAIKVDDALNNDFSNNLQPSNSNTPVNNSGNNSNNNLQKEIENFEKIKDKYLKLIKSLSDIDLGDIFGIDVNNKDVIKKIGDSSIIDKIRDFQNKYSKLFDFKNGNKSIVDTFVNTDDVDLLKEANKELSSIFKSLESNAKNKGFDLAKELDIDKQKNKIDTLLSLDNISDESKNELRILKSELENAFDPNGNNINITKKRLEEIKSKISAISKNSKSFGNVFKSAAKELVRVNSNWLYQLLSFRDIIRYLKTMATEVKNIDTALIELKKVTNDLSFERLNKSLEKSYETAKELGSQVTEVINATADWSRLGYGIADAEAMARITTLYKNIGDNMNMDKASEYLISTLKGFQLNVEDGMTIIDKFNEVANNYAIDTAGIGEALERSAASFNTANTSLSESIALITATNAVVQNPETVGTMWKTVTARIRGAKTELEDMGEDTEGMVESTSKLRDLIKGMTGFDIMKDKDTFKSIYEIVVGIGEKWQELNDIDKAALLEALAGKRAGNSLAAAFNNVEELKKVYETAENSAGSALKEQENYQKSIQYSLDLLKVELSQIYSNIVSSQFLKNIIELGTKILKIINDITGAFPPLLNVLAMFSASILISGDRFSDLLDKKLKPLLKFLNDNNKSGISNIINVFKSIPGEIYIVVTAIAVLTAAVYGIAKAIDSNLTSMDDLEKSIEKDTKKLDEYKNKISELQSEYDELTNSIIELRKENEDDINELRIKNLEDERRTVQSLIDAYSELESQKEANILDAKQKEWHEGLKYNNFSRTFQDIKQGKIGQALLDHSGNSLIRGDWGDYEFARYALNFVGTGLFAPVAELNNLFNPAEEDNKTELLNKEIEKYKKTVLELDEVNNKLSLSPDDKKLQKEKDKLQSSLMDSREILLSNKTELIEINRDIEDEFRSHYEEMEKLQEGGNVDLFNRPKISKIDENGEEYFETVYSSTFSNEDSTVYMNFTPIVVDEDGNYKGTLSPEMLQEYAEDVINGVHEDDLNLKIGATFDNLTDALAAAERIHELQEEYYSDIAPDTSGYEDLIDDIDNTLNSNYKKTVDDISNDYIQGLMDTISSIKDNMYKTIDFSNTEYLIGDGDFDPKFIDRVTLPLELLLKLIDDIIIKKKDFKEVIKDVFDLFDNTTFNLFDNNTSWGRVKDNIDDIKASIKRIFDILQPYWEKTKEAFEELFNTELIQFISNDLLSIIASIPIIIVSSPIISVLQTIFQIVASIASIATGIADGIVNFIELIYSGLDRFITKFNEFAISISEWLKQFDIDIEIAPIKIDSIEMDPVEVEVEANTDNFENSLNEVVYDYKNNKSFKTSPSSSLNKFNTLFNSDEYSNLRNQLIGLSKEGKLDEDTLLSYRDFNNLLKEIGVSADKDSEEFKKITELIKNMASRESLDGIKAYGDDLKSLSNAYNTFASKQRITIEELESLENSYGQLDTYKEFEEAVMSGEKDLQPYFDRMAAEMLSREDALRGLTEANKEYYVEELKSIGITNAREVVEKVLSNQEEERANVLKDLSDVYSVVNKSEEDRITTTEQLENATYDELYLLVAEAEQSDVTAQALAAFALKKALVDGTVFDEKTEINSLIKLAKVAGISTAELEELAVAEANLARITRDYENALANNNTIAAMEIYKGFEIEKQNIDKAKKKAVDSISSALENTDYTGVTTKVKPNIDSSGAEKAAKDTLDKTLKLFEAELDAGVITFQEYVNKSMNAIEDYYKSGKINAQEYYDYISDLYNKQISERDKVISAVQKLLDKEKDKLNKQKEDIEKSYNEQIETIQAKIDAIQDENDEIDRNMALSKAQYIKMLLIGVIQYETINYIG